MYFLESSKRLDKLFAKMLRRDPVQHAAFQRKIAEIREDPYRFKPLRAPMQNKRRVHVYGPFVLVYTIDESTKTVVLKDYDHHDKIYA